VVLASRLNRKGHTAVVSSSPDFAELAASHGIEYAPIGPSLTTIGDAEEISKLNNHQEEYIPARRDDPSGKHPTWLALPRMAAVVHHGGAGSSRSGVPTIITPFAADQPAWGQRVYTLGVGPKPIPFKKLTAEGLAAAIREAVTNPEIQKRARELGQCIQAEDGPGRTIELFFQYIEQFRRLK
jgi:UDP:flavonoid glycosyltransferase YjiC (YdhE family)